jgi:hypothetical protein
MSAAADRTPETAVERPRLQPASRVEDLGHSRLARTVLTLQQTAGNRAATAFVRHTGRRRLHRSPAPPAVTEDAPAASPAVARLQGAEAVYERMAALELTERELFTPQPRSDRLLWEAPANQQRLAAARSALTEALDAAGFASAEDFHAAAAAFLEEFRGRAVALTGTLLDASEHVVSAEQERYGRPAETIRLFADLATVRGAVAGEGEASAGAMGAVDVKRESVRPPQSQRAAIAASVEQHGRGEAARQALIPVYPILADPELRTEALAAATPAGLGTLLVADAAARLADIATTRANVARDHDLPYAWPRITGLALEAMGLDPDSVHGRLVAAHRARMERRERDVRAGWAALGIGFAALTFGGGAMAGVAAVGGALVSGVQAVDEWQRYTIGRAAAHSDFDAAAAVSAEEPSLLWVALALVGVGLDGAGLVWAFKAAAPAGRALARAGGGLAAFEAEIAQVAQLSPTVRQALLRAAAAEADYQRAIAELGTAWRHSLSGQTAGALAAPLADRALKIAYHFLRTRAIHKGSYDVFAEEIRGHKAMAGVDWTDPASTRDLRAAYQRAQANLSSDRRVEYATLIHGELAGQELAERLGRPFFAIAEFDDGPRRITFTADGDMELDGVLVQASKRELVYQKAGIWHAVTGHGPDSSYALIAQESNQLFKGKTALPGKSSRFATDEIMFRAIYDARRAFAAGRGVPSPDNPRRLMVDLPAGPATGRCFAHRERIPVGTPVLPAQPFPNLKNVYEVDVTHVRAIFEPDGTLVTIYPIGF